MQILYSGHSKLQILTALLLCAIGFSLSVFAATGTQPGALRGEDIDWKLQVPAPVIIELRGEPGVLRKVAAEKAGKPMSVDAIANYSLDLYQQNQFRSDGGDVLITRNQNLSELPAANVAQERRNSSK